MNSMRYLILLTFILYETQYAHSTESLKFLKSLFSKHLPSSTDQSIIYEEQPVYGYEVVNDDTVAEWNEKEYLINGNPVVKQNPVDQQAYEKLDIIPGSNFGTVPEENPETNLKLNSDENSGILLNSGFVYEANPGTKFEGNSEIDSEVSPQQALVKDKDTEWLLETTSGKQPEIVTVKNNVDLIKEKIIQKINKLKSNLKLKNQLLTKPVVEVISEDSGFLIDKVTTTEASPCETQSTTTIKPTTTVAPPCETQSTTTVQPTTTVAPPCETKSTTTVKPTTTEAPPFETKSTTAILTTIKIPVYTEKTNVPSTVTPGISEEPMTPENPVICDTEVPSVSTTTTTSPKPIVPVTSTTTVGPDSSTLTEDVNTDCQEPIVTIPSASQISLPPPKFYYTQWPYQVWLNPCLPPLTRENCFPSNLQYASNPIPANTFATNTLTIGNMPYNVQGYGKQKANSGPTKVINYISIDARPMIHSGQTKQKGHYAYDRQRPAYQGPGYTYTPQTPGSQTTFKTAFPNSGAAYSTQTNQKIAWYTPFESDYAAYVKINASQPLSPTIQGQRKQWIDYVYNNQKPTNKNPIFFTYTNQASGSELPFKTAFPSSGAMYSTNTNQPTAGYAADGSVPPANNIKVDASQPSYPTSPGQAGQWINYANNNQQLVSSYVPQTPEAPSGAALPSSGAVYSTQTNQPTAGYANDGSVLPANNVKVDANQPSYPTNPGQGGQWFDYGQNNQQLVSSNPDQTPGTSLPSSGVVYPPQFKQPISEYPVYGSVLPANNIKLDANQPSYPTNQELVQQWVNYANNNQQLVSPYVPQTSGLEAPSGTVIPNSDAAYSTQTNQPIAGYPVEGSVVPTNNIKIDSNQPSYPTNPELVEQRINYANNNQQLVSSYAPQTPEAPSGTAISNSDAAYSTQTNQPIAEYPVEVSVVPANNIKLDANQPSYPTSPELIEQWINYAKSNQQLVPSYVPQTSGPEAPPGIAVPNSGAVYATETAGPIAVYPTGDSVSPVEPTDLAAPENIDPNQYSGVVGESNGSGAPLRGDIRFGEDYNAANTYEQPEGDTLKQRRQVVAEHNKQTSGRNNGQVKMPSATTLLTRTRAVENTKAESPAAKITASDAKPGTPVVQTERPAVNDKTPSIEVESYTVAVKPVTVLTKKPVSRSDDEINLELVKGMLRPKSV